LRAAGFRAAVFFAAVARFAGAFFAATARFGAARFAAGFRAAAFFAAGFFAAARFAGAFFAAAFFGAAFFTARAAVAAFADFFAGFFAAGFFAAAFFGAAFFVVARTAIGCARTVLSSVVTLLNSLSAVVVCSGRTRSPSAQGATSRRCTWRGRRTLLANMSPATLRDALRSCRRSLPPINRTFPLPVASIALDESRIEN
jgi:hypothetical protein